MPAIDAGMTAIATEVTLNGTGLVVGVTVGFSPGVTLGVEGSVVMIGFRFGPPEGRGASVMANGVEKYRHTADQSHYENDSRQYAQSLHKRRTTSVQNHIA